MILSPTSTKIQSIYNPDVTYVTTDEPAESVGRIMQKYDLVAIPVVDSIGRLVGRITIDDVVDGDPGRSRKRLPDDVRYLARRGIIRHDLGPNESSSPVADHRFIGECLRPT